MPSPPNTSTRSRIPRCTLTITALIVILCALVAAIILVIQGTKNREHSATSAKPTIPDSAFLLREGKLDCSTIYDQASLAQLAESGIDELPGLNRFAEDSVTKNADGRISCSSSSVKIKGVGFSYHFLSQDTPWGGDLSKKQPDQFGWRHGISLKNSEGEHTGIGSLYSDEEHGFFLIVGMRNAEETTPEIDDEAAKDIQGIAKRIAPVLDRSLKAHATGEENPAEQHDSPTAPPSFRHEGHYSCHAFADTATLRQAQDIGLSTPRLPNIKNPGELPEDHAELCGFTHHNRGFDILTAAEPSHPLCTENTGVPMKKLPEWSYFIDPRPAKYVSEGNYQGQTSLNLLHHEPDRGCIVLRDYSSSGALLNLKGSLAFLSSIAGMLTAAGTPASPQTHELKHESSFRHGLAPRPRYW